MKALPWIVGLGFAGIVFWIMNKRGQSAYANSLTPSALTAAGLPPAPRPEPAPNVPSPTICQGVVTVGGAVAGAYYGVPPQVSLPLAATASKPVCKMAEKPITRSLTATVYEVPKVGIQGTYNATKETLTKSVAVAKSLTQSPQAFAKASIGLSKTAVVAPIKAVTNTLKAGDPRKWF